MQQHKSWLTLNDLLLVLKCLTTAHEKKFSQVSKQVNMQQMEAYNKAQYQHVETQQQKCRAADFND